MRLIKLGIKVGIVWGVAKFIKDVFAGIELSILKRVVKKLESIREAQNAEKKEESVEAFEEE